MWLKATLQLEGSTFLFIVKPFYQKVILEIKIWESRYYPYPESPEFPTLSLN